MAKRKKSSKTSSSAKGRGKKSRAKSSKAKKKTRSAAKTKAKSRPTKKKKSAKSGGAKRASAKQTSSAKQRERLKRERERERERARKEKERERARREREREQAQRQKEREKAQLQKEREREASRKEREREKAQQARERARAQKEKEREREASRREKERERARLQKEKARAQKEKEREKARLQKEKAKEKAQLQKEKARAQKEKEREKARLQKEKAKEKAQLKKEREAERARLKAEREAERARIKAEREAERARIKAEREAERERKREEARQRKEEERRAKEAEREAYRKAKEAEQSRIRAEREAQKRALEGRVAKAAGRVARGVRGSTSTRVYSPASIPDQSGTRKGQLPTADPRFANLRIPAPEELDGLGNEVRPRTVPPPPPEAPPAEIDERYALIQKRLLIVDQGFRREYEENFLMSWIYHDSALEGSVYTYDELRTAINPNITVVPDSSLQSVCEEIRRHKSAIELVQELGEKKRAPVNLDIIKRLYLTLHPEEGDLKTVKYRKDIPQHRLYFHEYAPPDKIAYKVRQVFDWLNGPEPKKLRNPIRIAARVHYDLLRVFPFPQDSGKVARLLMNVLLLRSDYPPAIIHSTERQKYYEALRGSLTTIITMLTDSIHNGLASIEKKLDERETRYRAFIS